MRDWIQWLRSEHPATHAELIASGEDLAEVAQLLGAVANGASIRSAATERARCATIVRMGVAAKLHELARELIADGTDPETAYLRFLGGAQGQDATNRLVAIRHTVELEQLATH